MLQQDGQSIRPQEHYEHRFLSAFPNARTLETPRYWREPDKELRFAFALRVLMHFAAYFGLITLRQSNTDLIIRTYDVTANPLLYEAVRFHL